MDRYQYLESLDRLLSSLPYDERREIMYDYEEHFKEGLEEGLDEETIIANLGSPEKVAALYITVLVPVDKDKQQKSDTEKQDTANPKQAQSKPSPSKQVGNNSTDKLIISIMLLFLGFMLTPFFIGGIGIIIGMGVSGIGCVIVGIALLVSGIFVFPFVSVPLVILETPVLLITSSISVICIGGLVSILTFYIIKFACYITSKYVKWNMHVIRGY